MFQSIASVQITWIKYMHSKCHQIGNNVNWKLKLISTQDTHILLNLPFTDSSLMIFTQRIFLPMYKSELYFGGLQ